MDACKSKFSCSNIFKCGIPQITLLGYQRMLDDVHFLTSVHMRIGVSCDARQALFATYWPFQIGRRSLIMSLRSSNSALTVPIDSLVTSLIDKFAIYSDFKDVKHRMMS